MEHLIEEVRKRPMLWDSRSELYKDATRKDNEWNEIAHILEKEKSVLKVEWKKLRDGFRHATVRKKTKSGQGAKNIKEWKYEKQMNFLMPTMNHRPSATNIPPPHAIDEPHNDNEEEDSEEDILLDQDTGEDVLQEPQKTAAKETRNRSPRGVDKLLVYMKDKEKNRTQKVINDVDLFFASASQSVQKLPRFLQTRVKREVLDSIARAEEEEEFSRMQQQGHGSVPNQFPRTHYLPLTGNSGYRAQHLSPSPSISSSSTYSRPSSNQSPLQTFQMLFNPQSSSTDEQTTGEECFTYQKL